MKKYNNGFTLVELLAVIVVLAIIMIIAIPSVLSTLTTARMKTFDEMVDKVVLSTEKEMFSEQLTSGVKTCTLYDLTADIGLSSVGDFNGYVIYVKSDNINSYYLTIWNSDYMAYGVLYGDAYVLEEFSSSDDPKLSKDNLAAAAGCSSYINKTDNSTGDASDTIIKSEVQSISFEKDSWNTIKEKVDSGDYIYKVGDKKEVDLGSYGVHTIRVANTSSPSECKKEGFSQTACGFVLEFDDVVAKSPILTGTNRNTGGWPITKVRAFINNEIYNALPSDLRNIIVNTYTVSAHGTNDESNFITNDKMYLASLGEVVGSSLGDGVDSARDLTRQMDIYVKLGVSRWGIGKAKKDYDGSSIKWWTRSTNSTGFYGFYTAGIDWTSVNNTDELGVSPAFKIN